MIHVPPKQQEQMASHGSGRPSWIHWFILESRPAIGSSSRRLWKGGVIDGIGKIARSMRQRWIDLDPSWWRRANLDLQVTAAAVVLRREKRRRGEV